MNKNNLLILVSFFSVLIFAGFTCSKRVPVAGTQVTADIISSDATSADETTLNK